LDINCRDGSSGADAVWNVCLQSHQKKVETIKENGTISFDCTCVLFSMVFGPLGGWKHKLPYPQYELVDHPKDNYKAGAACLVEFGKKTCCGVIADLG